MPNAWPGSVAPTRHSAAVGEQPVSWLEREGADPPVLLLHGWGASASTFTGLMRLCRTRRRILAPDLPGFGQSPQGETLWTTSGYADLVREMVRLRGWSQISLVGHSYGGSVSIRLAGEPGVTVDRLVLCDASGVRFPNRGIVGARVRVFRALRASAEAVLPGRAAESAVEWLRQRMGSADYRAAGALRPTLVHAVQEDLSGTAARISVPTLIVWGARDQELPLDPYGLRLRQLITSSELVEFESSGHFPFVDEPGRFAAVLDSFVDATL
jgi:pimeloyl-ACP methyl ester carboxylesterase